MKLKQQRKKSHTIKNRVSESIAEDSKKNNSIVRVSTRHMDMSAVESTKTIDEVSSLTRVWSLLMDFDRLLDRRSA